MTRQRKVAHEMAAVPVTSLAMPILDKERRLMTR